MPLPDRNMTWPPKAYQQAFDHMETWNAWYVGDTNAISSAARRSPITHPSQFNGGILGAGSRALLGKPNPAGENRTSVHLALAAEIATMSADLVFSEAPRFVIAGATKTNSDGTVVRSAIQQRVEEVINIPRYHATLLEGGQTGSALGGGYQRLIWDRTRLKHVRSEAVDADNAVPEFWYGGLEAVTFWDEVMNEAGIVMRHLERHERGRILHGLYLGTYTDLGERVPLSESPATRWLEEPGQPGQVERVFETGIDRLTAVYVPNMRPNKAFRKAPEINAFGQSDFADVIPLFAAADETLSSWMRDIRLGKARVIVSSAYLQSNGPGKGASFDLDREVYEGLEMLSGPNGEAPPITPHQFLIRVEEHERTLTALRKLAYHDAGYSPGSMGDPDGGLRTATEVNSDDQLSERTRDKKINYFKSEMSEYSLTWLQMESIVYGGPMPEAAPEIRFPGESQINLEELSRTLQQMRAAKVISIETGVRMAHPEWDGGTVNEEVERIKREEGIEVDPATVGTLLDPTRQPTPQQAAEMKARLLEKQGEETD